MPAVRKQAEATMTHCCGALAQCCTALRLAHTRVSRPALGRGDEAVVYGRALDAVHLADLSASRPRDHGCHVQHGVP